MPIPGSRTASWPTWNRVSARSASRGAATNSGRVSPDRGGPTANPTLASIRFPWRLGETLDSLRPPDQTRQMLRISLIGAGLLATVPTLALDEPAAWKDRESDCKYWLTRQGGIAPRSRATGQPDCPEVESSDRLGDRFK